jgi:hypothetical protein
VKELHHAATSTGTDRVVVAHPERSVVEELATGLARQGYLPVRVRTGREAILSARESADTVLVVLAARLGSPSALETTQFLQRGSDRAAPPVLVVVDPLDDDPRSPIPSAWPSSIAWKASRAPGTTPPAPSIHLGFSTP